MGVENLLTQHQYDQELLPVEPAIKLLPIRWHQVKLVDVCDIVMGQSPSSSTYNKDSQGLPFLQGKADFTHLHPIASVYCTDPLKVAKKENVLISVRAPVGDVNIADQDYIIGRGLGSLSLINGFNPFLFFSLLYSKGRLKAQGSGTTFDSINKATLANFSIFLPPLPEQRAIARVLQTAQNAIQARRKELALERERKATLMQHLFTHGTRGEVTKLTEIGEIPESWNRETLGQCAVVQTGVAKGRKIDKARAVELPYLRVANVQDGYLDLSEMKTIALLDSETERYKLYPGDVVVTEGGDFDKLGRGFLWKGEIGECVHQNHIFAVRANTKRLLPEYLAYLIQSHYGKAYFLSVAHKTTNLACINSTKLKAFPALLPPLVEQEEIATILQACDSKITALEKEITLQEELFRALLEELMSGRLSTLPLVEQEGA